MQNLNIRHDWVREEVRILFELPFIKLLSSALEVRQRYFAPDFMQISSLLSIKTGACPENCAYCAQSSHNNSEISAHDLLTLENVIATAETVKANGGTRICMGASGRSPLPDDFVVILEMIKAVKKTGLEACVSLGMLTQDQTRLLKEAGLDYYNHNLDSSENYYKKIITTRHYADRLETLRYLREAEIKICCGGIIGIGESLEDRIDLLCQLASFPEHPHSVPINYFMPMPGTPLENTPPIDFLDFVKVIAIARILMPFSMIRLAAGRNRMSEEFQVLCFAAGANSIFCGDKILTADNPSTKKDYELLKRLGMSNK